MSAEPGLSEFEPLHRSQYPAASGLTGELINQLNTLLYAGEETARSRTVGVNMQRYIVKFRHKVAEALLQQLPGAILELDDPQDNNHERIWVPASLSPEDIHHKEGLVSSIARHVGRVSFLEYPDLSEFDSITDMDVNFSGQIRALTVPQADSERFSITNINASPARPLEVGVESVYVNEELQPIAKGVVYRGAPEGTIRLLLGGVTVEEVLDPMRNETMVQDAVSR